MPKTILIAEDSANIQKLLHTSITRRGYNVQLASDGQVALQEINNNIPDLLITDINMPNLDGISLISILRADPKTSLLPIIALSAEADKFRFVLDTTMVQSLISKPIQLFILCATVHKLIGPA